MIDHRSYTHNSTEVVKLKPEEKFRPDGIRRAHDLCYTSLRVGSLVPRTGEARKSVGKARKSEPARELLIFEFRPSRGVKSAFHLCQII